MTPKVAIETALEDRALATWQARSARPGHRPPAVSFNGARVLTLESRRSPELALLIVNYGGRPVIAPSVREVPLESNRDAVEFTAALMRGEYAMVVLMTGVGTRLLLRLTSPIFGEAAVLQALHTTRILARGPKPVAALREVGLSPWLTAPSPNTWREVLATLDGSGADVAGARIAVQEYGSLNPELVTALQGRGAAVTSVPIYQWALPEDIRPLQVAISELLQDRIDVLVVTASVQVVHLLEVADGMGLGTEVRAALRRVVIASIGPMASEELRRQQLPVDFEPTHPKMGFLIKEVAERCESLLHGKRPVQSTER